MNDGGSECGSVPPVLGPSCTSFVAVESEGKACDDENKSQRQHCFASLRVKIGK